MHFVSPARRKSVLAPILNKIKNGTDALDAEKKGNGGIGGLGGTGGGGSGGINGVGGLLSSGASDNNSHVTVQIEPAKKVKVRIRVNLHTNTYLHSLIHTNICMWRIK